jgi:competence CoiA-like predicted nuclease
MSEKKMNFIDDAIEEGLQALREDKYRLRMYEVEVTVDISSDYGVEETLQDIRSLTGVTVVTAIDSLFRSNKTSYVSQIKIKFHPQLDSTTPERYLTDLLLPSIRNEKIVPGTKIIRYGKPHRIQ